MDHHDPLLGEFDVRQESMQHLVRVANLCNNCVYEIGVDEQGREIQDLKGDASEKGITRFINAHPVESACNCSAHSLIQLLCSNHVHKTSFIFPPSTQHMLQFAPRDRSLELGAGAHENKIEK